MIAGKEDLSVWREHPVTRALRTAMTIRIGQYLRAIPPYVIKDEQVKARAAAGALSAYEELFDELFTDLPPEAIAETDTDYIDPARRPTKET